MYSKIYWIDNNFSNLPGKIGTMGRPRGEDWLEDEVKNFSIRGVDIMVSLLEKDEIYELGLQEEGRFCEAYGIRFVHFPVPDRDIPEDPFIAKSLVEELVSAIHLGKKVVVHCRIGVGRSSMIAAGVLKKLGIDEPFERISQARGLKVPDTKAQMDWVEEVFGGNGD